MECDWQFTAIMPGPRFMRRQRRRRAVVCIDGVREQRGEFARPVLRKRAEGSRIQDRERRGLAYRARCSGHQPRVKVRPGDEVHCGITNGPDTTAGHLRRRRERIQQCARRVCGRAHRVAALGVPVAPYRFNHRASPSWSDVGCHVASPSYGVMLVMRFDAVLSNATDHSDVPFMRNARSFNIAESHGQRNGGCDRRCSSGGSRRRTRPLLLPNRTTAGLSPGFAPPY